MFKNWMNRKRSSQEKEIKVEPIVDDNIIIVYWKPYAPISKEHIQRCKEFDAMQYRYRV